MATVSSVMAALSTVAPLSKAAGWDAVGLQVGDPAMAVGSVAVCHEVTTAVVDRASGGGVDLLVAYHPLLFRPVGALVAGPSAAGRAFRLAASGVAVAVVHTAFDVAPGGAADALAAVAGLAEVRGFGPVWGPDSVKIATFVPAPSAAAVEEAMARAGAGDIGAYSGCSFRVSGIGSFLPGPGAAPVVGEPGRLNRQPEERLEMIAPLSRRDAVVQALVAAHPYEEPAYDIVAVSGNAGLVGRVGTVDPVPLAVLAARLGEALQSPGTRFSGDPDRPVRSVAVVPGSGSSFIAAAAEIADVLVTGDVSHHDARGALDSGLAVVDVGHAPSERPGVDALYAAVSRELPGTIRLDEDPHPWEGI